MAVCRVQGRIHEHGRITELEVPAYSLRGFHGPPGQAVTIIEGPHLEVDRDQQ